MFPGLGAGSSYLGYIPPDDASARSLGSNYLGGDPPALSISKDTPYLQNFLKATFSHSHLKGLSAGTKASLDAFANRLRDGDGSNNSAGGVASSPVSPQTLDFLNADLAEYYGMSRETAYQEALSNTAYQRAVKDMQNAGLNPAVIFGSGKGYTAGGVPFATSASSGGSRGSGSGGSGSGKLFSSGVYNAIATAAGIGGSIVAKGPAKVSAYWVSSNAAKGIMSALDALF